MRIIHYVAQWRSGGQTPRVDLEITSRGAVMDKSCVRNCCQHVAEQDPGIESNRSPESWGSDWSTEYHTTVKARSQDCRGIEMLDTPPNWLDGQARWTMTDWAALISKLGSSLETVAHLPW
jgi:hypothetical protein